MPLSCDCYGGCWGDHSINWPLIENCSMEADELRAIVQSVIPHGSYVIMPYGVRVEKDEYVELVYDRLPDSYFDDEDEPEFALEDITLDDALDCLGPLVGLSITGISRDSTERIEAIYPDPDAQIAFMHIHLSDGSTMSFTCRGPAAFDYPSDPDTALEDFTAILALGELLGDLPDDEPGPITPGNETIN